LHAGDDTPTRYEVVRLGADQWAAWDNFVGKSPQRSPFALSPWLRTLQDVCGLACDVWVAKNGDRWQAGVPVFAERWLGNWIAVHPPLTPYHSLLYGAETGHSSYPAKNTFQHLQLAEALINRLTAHYAVVRHVLDASIDDVRPWIWAGWRVRPAYTYHMDLVGEAGPATHAVRKQCAKFANSGARISCEWNLDWLWASLEETSRKHSFDLGFTRDALTRLATALERCGLAWMATVLSPAGHPWSCRVEVMTRGDSTAYDWVAGSVSDPDASGASAWLMVNIAEQCRQRGASRWDLCGADIPGVARFKSELGGRLRHGFVVQSPWRRSMYPYLAWRRLQSRLGWLVRGGRRGQ
jgi:hypothetical protein